MSPLHLPNAFRGLLLLIILGFTAPLLSGCGGGGGGSGGGDGQASQRSHIVEGTVAVGQPLANKSIRIYSLGDMSLGSPGSRNATTDQNGHYFIDMEDLRPPYFIEVYVSDDGPYNSLTSFSPTAGTVNVTPLTDLMVSRLLPVDLDITGVPHAELGQFRQLTEQHVTAAQTNVVNYLRTRPSKLDPDQIEPVDVSAAGDFVKTRFTPRAGDPYDDALEALTASLRPGENMFGVKEHMLNKGAANADLSIYPNQYPYLDTLWCQGNLCGPLKPGYAWKNVEALYSKYSFMSTLSWQVYNSPGGALVDCGQNPGIPEVPAGPNFVGVKDGILRLGAGPSGVTVPLLSLIEVASDIGYRNGDSNQRIITGFLGSTSNTDFDKGTTLVIKFDDLGKLTEIGITINKNGITQNTSCTAA